MSDESLRSIRNIEAETPSSLQLGPIRSVVTLARVDEKGQSKGRSILKLAYWYDWRRVILQAIGDYMQRLFSFPLIKDPIIFTRSQDETDSEDEPISSSDSVKPKKNIWSKFKSKSRPKDPTEDEELCNFDLSTKNLFSFILEERVKIVQAKDKYHYQEIDMSKFPLWNETMIDRLRTTFQLFDATGDGVIEFEELGLVLNEFGDKTSDEVRKRHFDKMDIDSSGTIDFEEFVTMTYNLTTDGGGKAGTKGKTNALDTTELEDSYSRIDRNMSRIRSLDVVQQLQSGLF